MSQGGGQNWGSRIGVVMAVMGSAVGLGNFLRFPGLEAKYGGSFMVPYLISLLVLGLPIAWCEWAKGRYAGQRGFNSLPGIFHSVTGGKSWGAYLGVPGVLIPLAVYSYYIIIEAWCLAYACQYLMGHMALHDAASASTMQSHFEGIFTDLSGDKADGQAIASSAKIGWWGSILPYLAICTVLNFVIIYKGIQGGIEKFCKWAMPVLVLFAVIVAVRVLTLDPNPEHPEQTVMAGLARMWNPDQGGGFWNSLANPQMWLAAAGQIFFTLSIGFGVIACYASYVKKDEDVAMSATTAAAGNEFCEVCLGGLISIPASYVFFGAAAVGLGTFALGFKTLPQVFAQMWGGQFFGCMFFFLLFIAAITSSISMLQPSIAFLEEGRGLSRKQAVSLIGLVASAAMIFVMYYSKDQKALDTIDFWTNNIGMTLLALAHVLVFGWIMGERGWQELHRGALRPVPRFFFFVIRYITPVFIIVLLLAFFFGESNSGYKKDLFGGEDRVQSKTTFAITLLGTRSTKEDGSLLIYPAATPASLATALPDGTIEAEIIEIKPHPINRVAWMSVGLLLGLVGVITILVYQAKRRWTGAAAAPTPVTQEPRP